MLFCTLKLNNMKRLLYMVALLVVLVACGNNRSNPKEHNPAEEHQPVTGGSEQYFGEKITAAGAISADKLAEAMEDKTEMNIKIVGTIEAVCQKKGCWMDMKTVNGPVRVTFKDYAFFIPKDASGRLATIEGVAKIEETSVADLKEYATDAGKSKEEIDAINEPEKELVFEAHGVLLN